MSYSTSNDYYEEDDYETKEEDDEEEEDDCEKKAIKNIVTEYGGDINTVKILNESSAESRVYKFYDKSKNEKVIKLYLGKKEREENFKSEIIEKTPEQQQEFAENTTKVLKSISSGNVKIDEENRNYQVFDYMEYSLNYFVENSSEFDLSQKNIIFLRTCLGIFSLHNKNVIHRDIKVDNILVDNTLEKVRIIDLGLSEKINRSSNEQIYIVGQNIPFEYENKKSNGEKIEQNQLYSWDIFALGVVFSEILTGNYVNNSSDLSNNIESLNTSEKQKYANLIEQMTKRNIPNIEAVIEKTFELMDKEEINKLNFKEILLLESICKKTIPLTEDQIKRHENKIFIKIKNLVDGTNKRKQNLSKLKTYIKRLENIENRYVNKKNKEELKYKLNCLIDTSTNFDSLTQYLNEITCYI